jgi:hypothetical protein
MRVAAGPIRARSSAEEHYLDMVGVTGSIPVAPTRFPRFLKYFWHHSRTDRCQLIAVQQCFNSEQRLLSALSEQSRVINYDWQGIKLAAVS